GTSAPRWAADILTYRRPALGGTSMSTICRSSFRTFGDLAMRDERLGAGQAYFEHQKVMRRRGEAILAAATDVVGLRNVLLEWWELPEIRRLAPQSLTSGPELSTIVEKGDVGQFGENALLYAALRRFIDRAASANDEAYEVAAGMLVGETIG